MNYASELYASEGKTEAKSWGRKLINQHTLTKLVLFLFCLLLFKYFFPFYSNFMLPDSLVKKTFK